MVAHTRAPAPLAPSRATAYDPAFGAQMHQICCQTLPRTLSWPWIWVRKHFTFDARARPKRWSGRLGLGGAQTHWRVLDVVFEEAIPVGLETELHVPIFDPTLGVEHQVVISISF